MLLLAAVGCQKHKILYRTTALSELNREAEFQLHYYVPMQVVKDNAIDSVFINGELYSSVNGAGQLAAMNGLPVTGGRFYAIKPGEINILFMKGKDTVYTGKATLKKGKSNVVVYALDKDPIVLDNEYPYFQTTRKLDLAHFDTDTVESLRFLNFVYDTVGVPYPGKLQYQYREYNTKDTIGWEPDAKDPTKMVPITEYNCWKNVGEPVGFGEATKRVLVHVDKIKGINASGFNSSGSQYLYYRILDEKGQVLQGYWSATATKLSNYSDYWTAYIGRVYNHFFVGVIKSNKDDATQTYARVCSWVSM